jgi:hypothetical protein
MFNASALSTLVLFAGHLLAGHSDAKTNLDLYRGDESVGVGTYEESTDHKGHRTSKFHIWTKDDSERKSSVFLVKVIDAQAFPLREEYHKVENYGKTRKEQIISVIYKDSGEAQVSEQEGKKHLTKRIFMPIPGLSRADASDLWFCTTVPLQGTRVTSTVFDIENMRWQAVETTYVGKRWITVGNRQVEANEIRDVRDGSTRWVYLDDKGQPLLMKNGSIRTERHF